MRTVSVSLSSGRSYDVLVNNRLLDSCGSCVRPFADRAVILTDDTVYTLYGQRLRESLRGEGIDAEVFVIPHGEASKTPETLFSFWDFLSEKNVDAHTPLIAFGGGVIGDLCGFAAATWHRGVPYIQIPTTLLSMVDASVGGKNAVDLPGCKNAVGTFYQPALVLCDPMLLESLPEDIYRDGMSEVIKTAVIGDGELLRRLAKKQTIDKEQMIARCIEIKKQYVEADEKDTGLRHTLNLGHTVAHAVESLSGYTISHGAAVGIGLWVITKAACRAGICTPAFSALLKEALDACGVNTTCPYSAAELATGALADKKKSGTDITLVLPRNADDVILRSFPLDDLQDFFEGGLS